MWSLKTADGEIEILRSESGEEIGREKMWYENRGYKVRVVKVRDME